MSFKVFNGLYMGSAAFGALRCYCMKGTVVGPDYLHFINLTYAAVTTHQAIDRIRNLVAKKRRRVWTRHYDRTLGTVFVSLHPGGYRLEPPPPEDIVEDFDDSNVEDLYQPTLKSLVNRFSGKPQMVPEIRASKRLLSGSFDEESRDLLARFDVLYELPPDDAHTKLTSEISTLYREGLFEYGMTLTDFSAAMGLCQLYVFGVGKVGRRLLQGDLLSNIYAVGRHANGDAQAKVSMRQCLDAIYQDSVKWRHSALKATSLMEHHRHTYTALHFLFMALAMTREFKYGPQSHHQLDEAYACTNEFLALSELLYFSNPFDLAKAWMRDIGTDLAEWKYQLRWQFSSTTHPVLPAFLFDLLAAYAEFLWHLQQRKQSPEQSLRRLIDVEAQHAGTGIEPEIWFDTFIRDAAKQCGNEAEHVRRSEKIANRLMVEKLLGL